LLMQFALLLHVFNCYCLWSYWLIWGDDFKSEI
jgi:hypothetical protein